VKTLTAQALDLQRQYKDGLKKLGDARDKCHQACTLAEQTRLSEKQAIERVCHIHHYNHHPISANALILVCDNDLFMGVYKQGTPAEQLRELTNTANNAAKRALAEDQKYVSSVKFMRGFRAQHDVALAEILDKFQQTEQQRLSLTCQSMDHYMTIMRVCSYSFYHSFNCTLLVVLTIYHLILVTITNE
jgi:hypothetical protein